MYKRQGISFAEGKVEFHYWKAKEEEIEKAEQELLEAGRRLDL